MKPFYRVIAHYLPQYHPIPENNEWWGVGFTEWTNTAKARPLFPGHYQPHVPADLGFYDLRLPEARAAQAEMAQNFGVEGFCYYHYWFGGRRLLDRPLNEVLTSKEPEFPFCICWANETWSGIWHGNPKRILVEQTYPPGDDTRHFRALLPAFADDRYLKIDGKQIFMVYKPSLLPDSLRTTDCWRELAHEAGLKGLFLIGMGDGGWVPRENGFDAAAPKQPLHAGSLRELKGTRKLRRSLRRLLGFPGEIYSYKKILQHLLVAEAAKEEAYPTVIPNWDNTPRCGKKGVVFHGSHPELFRIHLSQSLKLVANRPQDHRLVFVKSWNEWAEGNHLEPDLRFGKSYLEVLREEVTTRPKGISGQATEPERARVRIPSRP